LRSFTVATALYPEAISWIDELQAGLVAAMEGYKVCLVVALDGIETTDAKQLFHSSFDKVECVFVHATGTPAIVRGQMMVEALRCQTDYVVLVDADDNLCPGALDSHAEALGKAHISYGDMVIIDQHGHNVGRSFFHEANVPDQLTSISPITYRNFMGLTNTALRHQTLSYLDFSKTPHVTAFDWWMFTFLLRQGATAKQTRNAVTHYRQHSGGTLGARPSTDVSNVIKRCNMIVEHAAQFSDHAPLKQFGLDALKLADMLSANEENYETEIEQACRLPGVWFEDIAKLAQKVLPV